MGALLNGRHLGFQSEHAMNQHEIQQKSLDCREAFVLASVVELLRTSAWLGSVFRLILSTLEELQPTGKPAMFLFGFSSFQRLAQRCFQVQPLHPPDHARQVPRQEASFLDDQHNHGVYCVLHFYSGYTDSPC